MIAMLREAGRSLMRIQVVRFLATGLVNTIFGYIVYLVGLFAGLQPEIALLVATCVGAVWNYFTTARYVFAHRGFDKLPVFVAAYAFIYVVNIFAIRLLIDADISAALAQGLLLPLMAAASFLIFRTIVFKPMHST